LVQVGELLQALAQGKVVCIARASVFLFVSKQWFNRCGAFLQIISLIFCFGRFWLAD
jgi:hypothetical protein